MSMSRPSKPFPALRAAVVDERLANVFWRQDQIQSLHENVLKNGKALQGAIIKDAGYTPVEARMEFYLTLSCIRRTFDLLDADKDFDLEYRTANGKNAPERRQPAGIVYIEPTTHTQMFSVVAPLCAAIAGGNCVLVKLEQTLRELPPVLEKVLRSAIDQDVIDFTQTQPDESFLKDCVQVLQNGSTELHSSKLVVSAPETRVVAVVDRHGAVEEAARLLAMSRLSFGGKSPYAPDLVLVHEVVKKQFLSAVVQHSVKFLTEQNGVANGMKTSRSRDKKLVDEVQGQDGVRVVTSGSNGTILDVEKRAAAILKQKVRERCLCVHSVTSLDDAIDLANTSSGDNLLATYTFSNKESGKYVSQFVKTQAAFVNHIPAELLLGPASPLNCAVDPSNRYPVGLFTNPCPQYIQETPVSSLLTQVLLTEDKEKQAEVKKVSRAEDIIAPKEKRRPIVEPVGFFEQGFFTGLAIVATPFLAGISVLGYYGVRAGLTRWWAA